MIGGNLCFDVGAVATGTLGFTASGTKNQTVFLFILLEIRVSNHFRFSGL